MTYGYQDQSRLYLSRDTATQLGIKAKEVCWGVFLDLPSRLEEPGSSPSVLGEGPHLMVSAINPSLWPCTLSITVGVPRPMAGKTDALAKLLSELSQMQVFNILALDIQPSSYGLQWVNILAHDDGVAAEINRRLAKLTYATSDPPEQTHERRAKCLQDVGQSLIKQSLKHRVEIERRYLKNNGIVHAQTLNTGWNPFFMSYEQIVDAIKWSTEVSDVATNKARQEMRKLYAARAHQSHNGGLLAHLAWAYNSQFNDIYNWASVYRQIKPCVMCDVPRQLLYATIWSVAGDGNWLRPIKFIYDENANALECEDIAVLEAVWGGISGQQLRQGNERTIIRIMPTPGEKCARFRFIRNESAKKAYRVLQIEYTTNQPLAHMGYEQNAVTSRGLFSEIANRLDKRGFVIDDFGNTPGTSSSTVEKGYLQVVVGWLGKEGIEQGLEEAKREIEGLKGTALAGGAIIREISVKPIELWKLFEIH